MNDENVPPPLEDDVSSPLQQQSADDLKAERLLLLTQHSTIADMSQLRELSPDVDAEIRLKLYSNAGNDDDWFKQHIVIGETAEQALANAVFRSLAANTGSYTDPDDVTVETVTSTFYRLICYYNKNAKMPYGAPSTELQFSDHECLACAETYTLLHFIRNNYAQHVRDIFRDAMEKVEAARNISSDDDAIRNVRRSNNDDDDNDIDDKGINAASSKINNGGSGADALYIQMVPHWYRVLIENKFVNEDTPYALLNQFYKRHVQTINLAVPLSFAVRLFHFALVHEAYAVVGVLLSMPAMTNNLPLSIGRRLADHLSTRLDFTQSMQDKDADKVNVFIPEERVAKFKADLATINVQSLWPALSYLSDWQQANLDAQKHTALRKTLNTIESPDEQEKVAAKIIDTDAARRVEQCKLAASQVAKDLRFAVDARERARGSLAYVQKIVTMSCELLAKPAQAGDQASAAMLDFGAAYLQQIQQFLDADDAWFEAEYSEQPAVLPDNAMERQIVIGNAEKEHAESLQKYISVLRQRMQHASAELQSAVDAQQREVELSKHDKLLELKKQIEATTAASYFGDED